MDAAWLLWTRVLIDRAWRHAESGRMPLPPSLSASMDVGHACQLRALLGLFLEWLYSTTILGLWAGPFFKLCS